MYNTIQITDHSKSIKEFSNQFILDPFLEHVNEFYDYDQIFTEAVFTNGKKKMDPIVDYFEKIRNKLLEQIQIQKESIKSSNKSEAPKLFDPKAFWKDQLFKDLEDEISKIFGFRSVAIYPFIERFNSKKDEFETKILNCFVLSQNRFPIEGLVNDQGFYDKSKSITMEIQISLGLIKLLEPNEITAILLHEFGHSIDPAVFDITYTETNILSKYLLDRKEAITKQEKKFINKSFKKTKFISFITRSLKWDSQTFFSKINSSISKIYNKKYTKYNLRSDGFLSGLFVSKNKQENKKLEKIKKIIDEDYKKNHEFNRQNYSEAFADNFARMYGFGPYLMKALQKMDKEHMEKFHSSIKKEKLRQTLIFSITKDLINDCHKTDIHRIHSLIKEYEADIKNPNVPDQVKQGLKDDLEELKKVLDGYLNHFDEFQARIYKIIDEELSLLESKSINESIENESYENLDSEEFLESKKVWEKMKKEISAVTSSERNEFYKLFGHSLDCSLAKDKNGFYVRTHRCRSKSYKEIKDIPKKDVEFVRSTS